MKMKNMLPSLANPSQLTHGGVREFSEHLPDNSNSIGTEAEYKSAATTNATGECLGSILGGSKKPK